MFVVSMVMSVHLSHVIAHPFQLHGCSKEVELMKARDVGIESLLRAWPQCKAMWRRGKSAV